MFNFRVQHVRSWLVHCVKFALVDDDADSAGVLSIFDWILPLEPKRRGKTLLWSTNFLHNEDGMIPNSRDLFVL